MPREHYVSIDIETDGPNIVTNSMVQLGAAIIDNKGEVFSSFSTNMMPLKGRKPNPQTMAWWDQQIKLNPQLASVFQTDITVADGMSRFLNWVHNTSSSLRSRPIALCYPAGFDWPFVQAYINHCDYTNPFGLRVLDIKSYAMCKLATPFISTVKRAMPKDWFDVSLRHTHNAVDDAIEQGILFHNMLKA